MVSFAGRVLAEKGDWASVATMPTYAGNEKFSLTEVFVSDSFEYNHPRLIELDRKMRDFAAEHGVKINPNPLAEVLAPLNIVFIPKAFHIAGETFDDRFRFVGPSERPEEDAASWQPPSSGAPVVFVSLGTGFNDLPDFFRRCMKAFADDRWHVVMATGERLDEALLGSIPPNVEVAPYFPQQAVLRHAKVFVSHLGMGSAMDALYFGVPLVGVPRMPESRITGHRVEELALGECLNIDEFTSEALGRGRRTGRQQRRDPGEHGADVPADPRGRWRCHRGRRDRGAPRDPLGVPRLRNPEEEDSRWPSQPCTRSFTTTTRPARWNG